MEEQQNNKTFLVIIGITVVILAIVIFLVFFRGTEDEELSSLSESAKTEKTIKTTESDPPVPEPEAEKEIQKEEVPLPPVALLESDLYLKNQISEYFNNPLIKMLFKEKSVIRKIVAIVDNIAIGENPKNHFEFIPFKSPFEVITEGDMVRLNESSYSRYDEMVDAFISVDSTLVTNLFKQTQQLFNEAYRDLGYPDTKFKNTLKKAINNLLIIPVVFDKIYLDKGIYSYKYKSKKLEKLTKAQKQFLRIGPMNLRKIQKKVKDINSILFD